MTATQENENEDDRRLRRDLHAELEAIRQEDVPERLLVLAQQLQSRLRDKPLS